MAGRTAVSAAAVQRGSSPVAAAPPCCQRGRGSDHDRAWSHGPPGPCNIRSATHWCDRMLAACAPTCQGAALRSQSAQASILPRSQSAQASLLPSSQSAPASLYCAASLHQQVFSDARINPALCSVFHLVQRAHPSHCCGQLSPRPPPATAAPPAPPAPTPPSPDSTPLSPAPPGSAARNAAAPPRPAAPAPPAPDAIASDAPVLRAGPPRCRRAAAPHCGSRRAPAAGWAAGRRRRRRHSRRRTGRG